MQELRIDGLPPTLDDSARLAFELRLKTIFRQVCETTGNDGLCLVVSSLDKQFSRLHNDSSDHHRNNKSNESVTQYHATQPRAKFEQLILSESTSGEIVAALQQMEFEKQVFDNWGLREIEPTPRSAINLHGPPGTGKTLAAHAAASYLNRPICAVSYADVESKYHGDGPKNIDAVFAAAERDDSVLFFDEADSLLSRRLTNVSQGSEQAINSMRSQLLICLERHRGIVIFATNLVENYDAAFNTRVKHIAFSLPDRDCRARIWATHMPSRLPLGSDVDIETLADSFENVCGREIKNAVVTAAVSAAVRGDSQVGHDDFRRAMQGLIDSRVDASARTTMRPVGAADLEKFGPAIKDAINASGRVSNVE